MADQIAFELEPGALFVDYAVLDAEIENAAFLIDALAVQNIEFGFGKGRRDLVFDDFDFDVIADHGAGRVFERFFSPNVQPHAGVEFKGFAARGRFGIAEHDADFFPKLIGEEASRFTLAEDGGQFPQGLAHQSRLHTHSRHADFAFQFGFGYEGGHRIDHDDVNSAGAGEGFADGQSFFAAIGLRDEQIVQVDSQFTGVARVHRVLGIDKGRRAAAGLGIGDDMQHYRGFAGRLGSEDFHDSAPGQAADSQGQIQGHGAGGDHFDLG